METFLIKALQLILSLSILVIVHEFGHYLFARLFKIRVEKFYLFFDIGFSLFKFKPKNSDTEYGVGWLPLGGYVKISGMIDESMDKEQMQKPAEAWEFRSKPSWQRLLVMVGGVLFNILLAIVIYAMILFSWGDSYIPFKDITTGMEFSKEAQDAGFRNGDKLISADGKELRYHMDKTLDMNTLMSFAKADEVVVERDGKQQTIVMPADFADKMIGSKRMAYEVRVPAIVDSVMPDSEAKKCGLMPGDSIVSVNDKSVISFASLRKSLGENLNSDVTVSFYREDSLYSTTAHVDSTGVLGFSSGPFNKYFQIKHDKVGFFSSFPAGLKLAKETLQGYIAQFSFVFTKEGVSNLGGFGAIGGLFPATWDWQGFWFMTAFLSVILAVMNILPIPALDGGHVMFLLYEMITRRKPNEKFMEYAQVAGMVFLFALLIYANGNDLFKAIFK
ncbi:RIP metalloprotease RseP [Dysgonomonas macrotermitis]|uniref:Zinc metalloprotease n=1 Tax=Dysgonomonas macrotermitis TaxID=1346286 RepID=A0A1M4ZX51_9BACT|nr:RIP metalloprotease RseP [Dysgonomonas macrotermitis]SHF22312.1 regulator of sigma E protease [Dysgonomonas macrotermitis]